MGGDAGPPRPFHAILDEVVAMLAEVYRAAGCAAAQSTGTSGWRPTSTWSAGRHRIVGVSGYFGARIAGSYGATARTWSGG
jgi:aspartate aminotransferase-like enzyme